MPDHVHFCLSVPPKYSIANAIGRLKGKSAIRIHGNIWGELATSQGFIFGLGGTVSVPVGEMKQSSASLSAIKKTRIWLRVFPMRLISLKSKERTPL